MPLLKIMKHLFTITVHVCCKSRSKSDSKLSEDYLKKRTRCIECVSSVKDERVSVSTLQRRIDS